MTQVITKRAQAQAEKQSTVECLGTLAQRIPFWADRWIPLEGIALSHPFGADVEINLYLFAMDDYLAEREG